MTTPEVCTRIVKCLQDVWTDKMLFDFAVKISDETIQCHRLILAACSDFFKALFRSGMREVTENCVVLQEVTCDVFQLILKTIYTGENILTLENLFEVWRAVNHLQVTFMVDLCENFAIKAINLDTWENIYTNAQFLDSKNVLKQLRTFMLKNFDQVCLSTTFLQLSFDEVRDLIKSQDLIVVSEDIVLDSVIRWVEQVSYDACTDTNRGENTDVTDEQNHETVKENTYMENSKALNKDCCTKSVKRFTQCTSRKDKLSELVKLVRTCLVSPAVLSRVYEMEMVSENNVLKDITFNSLYYIQNFRHGQWPTAAVQRSCSKYINAGVLAQGKGTFRVIHILEHKWFDISKCKNLQENIQLVCFDNELYATGKQQNQPNELCQLFVFCDNSWVEVVKMPCQNLLLISHEQYIYIINKDDKSIHRVNPKKKIPNLEKFTDFPENVEVKHAMIFERYILMFSPITHIGNEETAVHKLDISFKIWTRLDNLDGEAEHIISFRNDKHSYVLQSNGNLWCILNELSSLNTKLKFVSKLWNSQKKLYGALTYNGQLNIVGNFQAGDTIRRAPDHIQSSFWWKTNEKCSNFIPITMLKIR
ncbi:kelch-like protein 2 [Physella acuta]|uniref:kelch-like protein 2 n=1 Tax=Physella acuta TaxID=109671 RepID=UPI0027DB8627|nr:kelch-like protein 2 [Physella acuta]